MRPTPKNKKEWKAVLAEFELKQWMGGESPAGWLTILPHGASINPIPFVVIEDERVAKVRRQLAKHGFHLAWSTLFLVEGHHHPKGTEVFAVSRPGGGWWAEHMAKQQAAKQRAKQQEADEARREEAFERAVS